MLQSSAWSKMRTFDELGESSQTWTICSVLRSAVFLASFVSCRSCLLTHVLRVSCLILSCLIPSSTQTHSWLCLARLFYPDVSRLPLYAPRCPSILTILLSFLFSSSSAVLNLANFPLQFSSRILLKSCLCMYCGHVQRHVKKSV